MSNGFHLTGTVQEAFSRHPANCPKEFFVALATGAGFSRSKGKKEFERAKASFERGHVYRGANFVERGVADILAGNLAPYHDFRTKERRVRVPDDASEQMAA